MFWNALLKAYFIHVHVLKISSPHTHTHTIKQFRFVMTKIWWLRWRYDYDDVIRGKVWMTEIEKAREWERRKRENEWEIVVQ